MGILGIFLERLKSNKILLNGHFYTIIFVYVNVTFCDYMPLMNRNEKIDWKEILKDGFLGTQDPEKKDAEKKILDGINELKTKFENQNKMIIKLVAMISKMHKDGEINRDTFNKLDQFLKSYYENPYDNY